MTFIDRVRIGWAPSRGATHLLLSSQLTRVSRKLRSSADFASSSSCVCSITSVT